MAIETKASQGLRNWGNPQGVDTRNVFKFNTDEAKIRQNLDEATEASYANKLRELSRLFNKSEDAQYSKNQNLLSTLTGSLGGALGRNTGANAATALQAILGLGAQGTENTTSNVNQLRDVVGQKQADMAKNAMDAINTANSAKSAQAGISAQQYASDKAKEAAAVEAYAALHGTYDANDKNYKLGQEQIRANKLIAGMTQKNVSTVYNR